MTSSPRFDPVARFYADQEEAGQHLAAALVSPEFIVVKAPDCLALIYDEGDAWYVHYACGKLPRLLPLILAALPRRLPKVRWHRDGKRLREYSVERLLRKWAPSQKR